MTLPAALTVAVLSELKAQIDTSVKAGQGIVLDLGAVERIDSAGVQFLLAVLRHFDGRLRAVGHSAALHAASKLYQLDAVFAPLLATRESDDA